MPTRPTPPDPSGDAARAMPFSGLGAGLDFFQDWLKAAGSALPNLPGTSGASSMGSWALPTLDPEELDKRIQDLKTVQFWLEQNSRMIAMTIQGLEVQKMTLSTLKGMNVSMDSLRDALKARNAASDTAAAASPFSFTAAAPAAPAPAPAPQARPAAHVPEAASADEDAPSGTAPQAGAELINPLRWWDTLTEQFTHLASQATQTAQTVGTSMSDMLQPGGVTPVKATAKTAARKARSSSTSGSKSGTTARRKPAPASAKKPAAKTTRRG
jgi:hypothetical protein